MPPTTALDQRGKLWRKTFDVQVEGAAGAGEDPRSMTNMEDMQKWLSYAKGVVDQSLDNYHAGVGAPEVTRGNRAGSRGGGRGAGGARPGSSGGGSGGGMGVRGMGVQAKSAATRSGAARR